ncbi:MAG: hypothetical protein U9R58_01270 [Chloroflexota bacterium]|nr:hypothetical protein [Chloroflexota bacterium]
MFAGIRSGVVTVFRNFSSLLVVWLIWIGVRLIWVVAAVPILFLLTPVFLLMFFIGALVAVFPALITAGLSSLLLSGIWPWVVAGMIAVPIFIFIVGIPLAFVDGLAEIYKSNLWTLSYRDLRPSENEVLESSVSPDVQEPPMHELEASSPA